MRNQYRKFSTNASAGNEHAVAIEATGLGDGAGGVKLFEVTATLIRGK
jgi:hypothetical protein